ncbi:dTDP-4-amino-4,6-dideoxygalactose transaminase [Intrasporangium mesophilum]
MERIMFSAPYRTGLEQEYLAEVLASTHWHGDGSFTQRATEWLVTYTAASAATLTTSGTHALEMAALLLDLGPHDEVLVPAFTFSSTASAVALRGATPVFVDISPDTLNIDPDKAGDAITPRTKAVFALHYGGVSADMTRIMSLAGDHALDVVEDNAHGLGAFSGQRHLGTFGTFGIQSWHDTKNITSGEGGALLINDASYLERANVIREKGTNRTAFLRGAVDKYTWVDHGSSYLPSELLAAVLLAQFESFELIQARRHAVWDHYASALPDWAGAVGARLMAVPEGCRHSAHLFYVVMPEAEDQQGLIDHLASHDIVATFHYQPLDSSPAGLALGRAPEPCRVTQNVAARLVRLPLHAGMSVDDARRVTEVMCAYRTRRR